jgi:hypothetical protein
LVTGISGGSSTIRYTITNLYGCTNYAEVVVVVNGPAGIEDLLDNDGLAMINHPNPFAGSTTLSYILPFDGHVILIVRNLAGQVIKTVVNEKETQGVYTLNIDAGDLQSGVYLVTLRLKNDGKEAVKTIRMVKGK